jgi:TRAP-type C4-dicarboxylate transport system substrate-binding protein
MKRGAIATLGLVIAGVAMGWGASARAEVVLRFGTVAPPGSKWAQKFRKLAKEVRKITDGAVRFKLTSLDIVGGESEILKLIEEKKLEGAALTGVSIGNLVPAYLVQQLPLLFRRYAELDCFRKKMAPKFDFMLEEKGWVSFGHGDVGFVYVFTKDRVTSPEGLEKIKMWGWDLDRIGRKMLKLAGVNPVKAKMADVRDALEKGELEGFYGSPYAIVAMRWHEHAKFMIAHRLALVVGALVVTKAAYESIPEKYREIVKTVAHKWADRVAKVIRKMNKNARKSLEKSMTQVRFTAGEHSIWTTVAEKTHAHFTDKLYPKGLLDDVKAIIAKCRED